MSTATTLDPKTLMRSVIGRIATGPEYSKDISAEEAREAGFVNVVVAPGHTEAEARKVAREICALPAEAVAITRKLIRLPPEDITRRIDQEGHHFGERMRSKEAIAAFKAFADRKRR